MKSTSNESHIFYCFYYTFLHFLHFSTLFSTLLSNSLFLKSTEFWKFLYRLYSYIFFFLRYYFVAVPFYKLQVLNKLWTFDAILSLFLKFIWYKQLCSFNSARRFILLHTYTGCWIIDKVRPDNKWFSPHHGIDLRKNDFISKNSFILKLRRDKICYRSWSVVNFERAVCKYYLFTTCFIDEHRIVIESISVVYRCE